VQAVLVEEVLHAVMLAEPVLVHLDHRVLFVVALDPRITLGQVVLELLDSVVAQGGDDDVLVEVGAVVEADAVGVRHLYAHRVPT